MDLRILDALFFLSIGTTLIPIGLILSHYKRQPIEYKWLAFTLIFSFLCDFAADIFYRVHIPVNIANNFYATFNPLFFSCFFYTAIQKRRLKLPLILLNLAHLLFSFYNVAFIQKASLMSYSSILEKLLIMGLSIVYFYKILQELPAAKIYHIGLFWIVSALFITNSAKLVLYSFVTYLISNFKDNLVFSWSIHNLMSVICNLTIAWGIWVNNKRIFAIISKHT